MTFLFDNLPIIKIKEPLIDFFGTPIDDVVEFSFKDVVKIAGHACPTVLGAYLLTHYSLKALYGNELPVRGEIEIFLSESEGSGTTGVVGNVISVITGAFGIGGFKGLAGKFSRNNKINYSVNQEYRLIFQRQDNGHRVSAEYNPEIISFNQNISPFLDKCIKNIATKEEKELMNLIWNERLQKIINAAEINSNEIIKITKLNY